MPFVLVDSRNRPGLESHETLFKRSKLQTSYLKEIVRKPQYPLSFSNVLRELPPIPENPGWFQELEKLHFSHFPLMFLLSVLFLMFLLRLEQKNFCQPFPFWTSMSWKKMSLIIIFCGLVRH